MKILHLRIIIFLFLNHHVTKVSTISPLQFWRSFMSCCILMHYQSHWRNIHHQILWQIIYAASLLYTNTFSYAESYWLPYYPVLILFPHHNIYCCYILYTEPYMIPTIKELPLMSKSFQYVIVCHLLWSSIYCCCLHYDNPTINSSIVRYDSNCSHKPHGTSKPTFSSTKGYLTSITSIIKIQSIIQ